MRRLNSLVNAVSNRSFLGSKENKKANVIKANRQKHNNIEIRIAKCLIFAKLHFREHRPIFFLGGI